MWPKIKTPRSPGSGGILPAVFAVVLTLLFALSPTDAAAYDSDTSTLWEFFGTEHGDAYSSVFLNQLFGPLFPSANGTEVTSVFPQIIAYFNVIILLIGGLMFFYNVAVGVMQSAHEGSVLGQRWSSLWAPLRVIFAVGMLVPVNEGYNLAQSGVAYLVKGSTKMASAVWSSAATAVLSGEVPIAGIQTSLPPEVIRGMYTNAACVAAMNGEAVNDISVSYVLDVDPGSAIPSVPNIEFDLGEGWELGDAISTYRADSVTMTTAVVQGSSAPRELGLCGSYSTPAIPAYITRLLEEYGPDTPGYEEAIELRSTFVTRHAELMAELNSSMQSVATSAYAAVNDTTNTPLPDIAPQIADIHRAANQKLGQMNQELLTTVKTSSSVRDALSARISGGDECTAAIGSGPDDEAAVREGATTCYGEGWMGAGSWYVLMARLNNEINSLLAAMPSVSTPTYDSATFGTEKKGWQRLNPFSSGSEVVDFGGNTTMKEIGSNLTRLEEAFDVATVRLAALGYAVPTEMTTELAQTGGEGLMDNLGSGFSNTLMKSTRGIMDFFDPGRSGQDPMVGLIQTGHWLLAVAAGIGTVAVGTGLLGLVGAGAIATNMAMFLKPFFSVFMAAGGTLSFILPMMPFLYWVLAVSGYFLLIFEAIVAVNLWALSHLRMDGEGLSGEAGRQGWLMVLSLFMTPTLMVFGFLIGMGIFRVVSDLLSAGMFYAVSSIIGSSILAWMFGLVAYAILIVTAYIFLLERSFSLISEFPNRVMRWMGSSVEIGGGEDRIRAAAGGAAYGLNQLGNQMEKGMGDKVQDKNGTTQLTGLAGGMYGLRQRMKAKGNGVGKS